MILEDIAQYIEGQGVATVNTDLFLGELPLETSECISMWYAVSPDPHKTFDAYEQHIDFWARHKDSRTGYNKLLEILRVFHRKHHYETANYYIYYSNVLGIIDDMDRDSNRRKLYKMSIRFIFRPITEVVS